MKKVVICFYNESKLKTIIISFQIYVKRMKLNFVNTILEYEKNYDESGIYAFISILRNWQRKEV